jgi:hypothetical protein
MKIFESASQLTQEDIVRLPRITVDRAWNGAVLNWSFFGSVALDSERLHFVAGSDSAPYLSAPCHPEPYHSEPHQSAAVNEGTFFEGLWHHDVIELFISCGTARYLEFHLSPNGCWWAQAFSGPLERDPQYEASEIRVIALESSPNGWSSLLTVSRAHIVQTLGDLPSHAHITCKFNSKPEPTPYASLVSLSDDKPNFHQPLKFPKIEWEKL